MILMSEQQLLKVGVECCAGHRGEQTPRTLILGDRRIDVAEVVAGLPSASSLLVLASFDRKGTFEPLKPLTFRPTSSDHTTSAMTAA